MAERAARAAGSSLLLPPPLRAGFTDPPTRSGPLNVGPGVSPGACPRSAPAPGALMPVALRPVPTAPWPVGTAARLPRGRLASSSSSVSLCASPGTRDSPERPLCQSVTILACQVVVLGAAPPQTHSLPVAPLPALIKAPPSLAGTSRSPAAPAPDTHFSSAARGPWGPEEDALSPSSPATAPSLPWGDTGPPTPCPTSLFFILSTVLSSSPVNFSLHTRLSLSVRPAVPWPGTLCS